MLRITDAELAARQLDSQLALFEAQLAGGRDSFAAWPADGVLVTCCPRAPDRSLPNAVLARDPAALTDALLDEIGARYDAAGVRAWTVWVRPGDDALSERLAARGHVHDAEPMLMAATMDELDLGPAAGLDLDPAPTWETVAALNDAAYGLDGEVAAMLEGVDDSPAMLWVARVGGAPAACAVVRPHEGDAEVFWVAVAPEARGRGLAGALMRRSLAAARDAGCTTASLEATKLGLPVYERMGFRSLGRFGMWERRQV
ncbi:MAG TPA: GNAT family N-acetyltransferase [Capillimicrobium sp.]